MPALSKNICMGTASTIYLLTISMSFFMLYVITFNLSRYLLFMLSITGAISMQGGQLSPVNSISVGNFKASKGVCTPE